MLPIIIPVVTCDGAGTDLSPILRDAIHKRFLPLLRGVSRFQRIMRLLSSGPGFNRAIVVTSANTASPSSTSSRRSASSPRLFSSRCGGIRLPRSLQAAQLALAADAQAVVGIFAAGNVMQDRAPPGRDRPVGQARLLPSGGSSPSANLSPIPWPAMTISTRAGRSARLRLRWPLLSRRPMLRRPRSSPRRLWGSRQLHRRRRNDDG